MAAREEAVLPLGSTSMLITIGEGWAQELPEGTEGGPLPSGVGGSVGTGWGVAGVVAGSEEGGPESGPAVGVDVGVS